MPEAPEPTVDERPLTGRDIARDLLRPSRTHLILAVVLFLCGFAVTIQLDHGADERYSTLRQADLVAMLDDVTAESRRLEGEVAELESTKRQLQSGVDADRVAREQAARRLTALELLAGTVPAVGPGVRVTIVDPETRMTPEIALDALTELRDAGAEVIEVNDRVRVVASTWVVPGTDGLVVDGVQLSSPYVIEAIGDPDTLAEAMRFRGGLVSTVEGDRVAGSVQVTRLDAVTVEATHDVKPARFARPG